MASDGAAGASTSEGSSVLCIKWSGQEFNVPLSQSDTVASLKHALQNATHVLAKRQKLLGLKTRDGKPAGDEALIADLAIKPGVKIMMMGTPEAAIAATEAAAEAAPEIQDDFDLGEDDAATLELKDRPEVQEKLERRIRSVEVKVLNPPRPGAKCLVLDIDYTLFDLNSTAERPEELARPFLHEFLTAAYLANYDIIIWSATSMKWVEVKMKELGVLGNPNYKLVCMLDHAAMVTVHTEKYGVFDCKPLAFIWAKFPDLYGPSNTIMFDDLRRNYVLNKQQGLVIRPYRKAAINRQHDRELMHLSRYLTLISTMDSLESLDHKRWEQYLSSNKHAMRAARAAAASFAAAAGAGAGSASGAGGGSNSSGNGTDQQEGGGAGGGTGGN